MSEIQNVDSTDYDKITSKTVNGRKIRYGIVYGNDKIVFIKTGVDGSIRGYQNKYPRMAHRIRKRLGATVICASNPDTERSHTDSDKSVIAEVAAERNFIAFQVLFVGTSDGAYKNLTLAREVSQTVKFLGINTSLNTEKDLSEKLLAIAHVEKILVYGTGDDDFACVSALKDLACDNLKVMTVAGADHYFTGMLDAYIALVDLL